MKEREKMITVNLEFDINQRVKHRKTGMTGKIYSIELHKRGNDIYAIYHLIAEDSEGTPLAGVLIKEHGFGLDAI